MKMKVISLFCCMLMITNVFIVPAVFADDFIDQKCQNADGTGGNNFQVKIMNGGYNGDEHAQSFKPQQTPLTKVELWMRNNGGSPGDFIVSIRSSIDGNDLRSVTKSQNDIENTIHWEEFIFSSNLDVTVGNTYYIVFKGPYTQNDPNTYNVHGFSDGSHYPAGCYWHTTTGPGTWVEGTQDISFRTYTSSPPPPNNPPNESYKPQGPSFLTTGQSGTYQSTANDQDEDQIQVRFEWGDGITSGWSNWVPSGTWVSMDHSWSSSGTYEVKAQVQDEHYATTEWSNSLSVDVFDNSPPYGVNNPSPINNAEGVVTNGIYLSWHGLGDPEGDNVRYDVYINAAPQPDEVLNETGKTKPYDTIIKTGDLCQIESKPVYSLPDIHYYWKVIATDMTTGLKTEGPIWEFDTETFDQCEPFYNNPPQKPSKPERFPPLTNLFVGDTLVLQNKVVDPDGDTINIYWDMNEDDVIDYEVRNVTSNTNIMILYKWDSMPPGPYNIRTIALDKYHNESDWSTPLSIYVQPGDNNLPPNNATIPGGIDTGYVGQEYTFTAYATDPEGNNIKYRWDFGDGTITDWENTEWVPSGTIGTYPYHWDTKGYYKVKVQVMDINGATTPWSDYKLVNITKKKTATIFNNDDFYGIACGDEFNLFQGSGRLAYANGTTGAIVTGAFAGFPGGAGWSRAVQGVSIYIGRQKEVTIDAELSYIGSTYWTWPTYACIEKIIKINEWYGSSEEFREWINNIVTIEDLESFCTGMTGVAGQIVKNPKVAQMIQNELWMNNFVNRVYPSQVNNLLIDEELIVNNHNIIPIPDGDKYKFLKIWKEYDGAYKFPDVKTKTVNTQSTAVDGTMPLSSALLIVALIITIASEIWTYYQYFTHWQVDTLLKEYENEGLANTEHFVKSTTFEVGDHSIWAGLQTSAGGFGISPGFAYTAGMVRSITIDGIAAPEEPILDYPPSVQKGKYITFKPYAIDQNDDPIKFNISWGDGSTPTVTEFYDSGQEDIKVYHKYQQTGTYNITIKTEDCDKMESDVVTYPITVINNGNPYGYFEPFANVYSYNNGASSYNNQISGENNDQNQQVTSTTTTTQNSIIMNNQDTLLNQILIQNSIQPRTR